MSHRFIHRYSTHSDRSRRAEEAEFAGLEAAVDAGRRLGIPWRHLIEVADELLGNALEWHHVSVRGESASKMDFRRSAEWDRTALEGRKMLAEMRQMSRGLTRPQQEKILKEILERVPQWTLREDVWPKLIQLVESGYVKVSIDKDGIHPDTHEALDTLRGAGFSVVRVS